MQCHYGFSVLSEECRNHKEDAACEPCLKAILELQLQGMLAKLIADMSAEERAAMKQYIAVHAGKE